MIINKENLKELDKKMNLLPLTFDPVFKGVFTKNLEILKEFLEQCGDACVIEKPAKLEGRSLFAIIAPKKK